MEQRNEFESAETFAAFATIDAGFYMIDQIIKKAAERPSDPLSVAVDKATGYDRQLEKEQAMELIPILEDIIAAKAVIGIDASPDIELLRITKEVAA